MTPWIDSAAPAAHEALAERRPRGGCLFPSHVVGARSCRRGVFFRCERFHRAGRTNGVPTAAAGRLGKPPHWASRHTGEARPTSRQRQGRGDQDLTSTIAIRVISVSVTAQAAQLSGPIRSE